MRLKRHRYSYVFLCLTCLHLNSGRAASRFKAGEGLQTAVQRALYGIKIAPGGFAASNPAQHLSTRFTPGEVRLRYQENSVGLRLQRYGYGEHLVKAEEAWLAGSGNRIEYRRGNLTEWYVNQPEGVEQGFTLARRPGHAEPGERLTIALEVTGGMQPAMAPAGDAVLLESAGQARLRYTGLRAWDAAGRELAARLEVRGTEVRLAIADAGATYPLTVDPFVQQAKLAASDGAAGDSFGQSVAVDGNTAVVGAYNKSGVMGAAYVFVLSNGAWSQQAELTASDGAANDDFGFSVAVYGDTAVIGAFGKANGTKNAQGAAYVFTRSGTVWSQQAKLLSADGAAGDHFGWSVAVNADTAVLGAYSKANGAKSGQGAAYVFTRSGAAWSQQAKLLASDGAYGDNFGVSVGVSGDTAVIGTPFKASQQGAAYVYTRSGTTWGQQTKLTASDGAGADNFGYSVAVNGNTALIGAYQNGGNGAAYVFVGGGTSWSQQAKLTASDGAAGDEFGLSVALNGDTAVIGANGKTNSRGAAYAFGRGGTAWMQLSKATASDGATSDNFGISVTVSGNTIVIGAAGNAGKGAAYAFTPGVPSVITIASNPAGLGFTAAGTGCPSGTLTTPYALPAGVGCTIAFTSPALNDAGNVSYTFQRWNDSSTSNPRSFPMLWQDTTFTATFITQYLLTSSATPAPGGQVTGTGWYTPPANVTVAAITNAGYSFTGFSGDLSGLTTPQTVSMSGPKSVTGTFTQLPGAALNTLVLSKTGTQSARLWTVGVTNGGPGVAYAPQIDGLMLTQTYGTACTPVRLSPLAFPVNYANLAVGGTATLSVQFDFTGCPSNARFTVSVASVANSGSSVGAATLANQTM